MLEGTFYEEKVLVVHMYNPNTINHPLNVWPPNRADFITSRPGPVRLRFLLVALHYCGINIVHYCYHSNIYIYWDVNGKILLSRNFPWFSKPTTYHHQIKRSNNYPFTVLCFYTCHEEFKRVGKRKVCGMVKCFYILFILVILPFVAVNEP